MESPSDLLRLCFGVAPGVLVTMLLALFICKKETMVFVYIVKITVKAFFSRKKEPTSGNR